MTVLLAMVASIASFLGSRKLRPYPSATFTTSPRLPSLGTSSFRMTSMNDSLSRWSMVVSRWQTLRTPNDWRPSTILCLLRAPSERQQCDIARLLDRPRQTALVRRAYAGQTARSDLAAFRDELRQQTHILVIDCFDLFDAELANLFAPEELAPALAWTARTATRTWSAGGTAAFGSVATTTLWTTFAA